MAGELKATFTLVYANASLKTTVNPPQFSINQAVQGYLDNILSIPTSDTVITTSGVSALGVAWILNLDGTNYVDVGPTVSGAIAPLVRLLPGEGWPFRLKPGITLRAQANTAACKIRVLIFEA